MDVNCQTQNVINDIKKQAKKKFLRLFFAVIYQKDIRQ